jgi:hypothetical protein
MKNENTMIVFQILTSYFHFVIYFTKNMNQVVYNEEIKSHDLHTIIGINMSI